jgi:uncharacterized membrane protein
MADMLQPVPKPVTQSRQAVMATYFGLIGLFTGDALVTLFSGAPLTVVIFLWLFRVLPLLIFLPGLRSGNLRVHAWLCFVVLLYFIHAVTTAFVPGSMLYGIVSSLLCTALFVALVVYIRMARKHLGQTLNQ